MPRLRRYAIIFGLLIVAVLLAFSWNAVRERFPNLFDAERVDARELERLRTLDFAPMKSATGDWPGFRGANRDGQASAENFNSDWDAKPPKVLWKTPCGGGYSSCAVVDGVVYTQDLFEGNERLIALDADSGAVRWTEAWPVDYSAFKLGYVPGPRGTPTVQEGIVYALGALGRFTAHKLPTDAKGKPELLFQKEFTDEFHAELPQWGFACSPLIIGELVVVQSSGRNGAVLAFDRKTGVWKWKAGSANNGYSSPVFAKLGGVPQVVAVTGNAAMGLNPSDGKILWEHSWTTQQGINAASPIIVGDYVFISSNYGKGCALLCISDGKTAKVVYFRPGAKGLQTHQSTAVHRQGVLYGFDGSTLKAWNLREGKFAEDWAAPGSMQKGNASIVGDRLLIQSQNGTLALAEVDPTEFKPKGSFTGALTGSECWANPAVVNGRIYTRDGVNVVCVDARER